MQSAFVKRLVSKGDGGDAISLIRGSTQNNYDGECFEKGSKASPASPNIEVLWSSVSSLRAVFDSYLAADLYLFAENNDCESFHAIGVVISSKSVTNVDFVRQRDRIMRTLAAIYRVRRRVERIALAEACRFDRDGLDQLWSFIRRRVNAGAVEASLTRLRPQWDAADVAAMQSAKLRQRATPQAVGDSERIETAESRPAAGGGNSATV